MILRIAENAPDLILLDLPTPAVNWPVASPHLTSAPASVNVSGSDAVTGLSPGMQNGAQTALWQTFEVMTGKLSDDDHSAIELIDSMQNVAQLTKPLTIGELAQTIASLRPE